MGLNCWSLSSFPFQVLFPFPSKEEEEVGTFEVASPLFVHVALIVIAGDHILGATLVVALGLEASLGLARSPGAGHRDTGEDNHQGGFLKMLIS